MTEDKLTKARLLLDCIKSTEKGLSRLKAIKSAKKKDKPDNSLDDGMYNFFISEYRDGSVESSAELSRYKGNRELYNTIVDVLEHQLKLFKEEFEAL